VKKVILALGTGLGVGYFPFCPGTVGSLWGVVIYLLIWLVTSSLWWQFVITVFILMAGVWICGRCEKVLKNKDHRSIVIDEVGGFLVSLIGFSFSIFFLFLGFIFFRLFDIIKPFRIDRLQHLPGGWGIVADDVAAGLLANLFLRILISMAGWHL